MIKFNEIMEAIEKGKTDMYGLTAAEIVQLQYMNLHFRNNKPYETISETMASLSRRCGLDVVENGIGWIIRNGEN